MNTRTRLAAITALTAALAFVGLVAVSFAQQPAPTPPTPRDPAPAPQLRLDPPDPMKTAVIVGELTKVDTTAKTLTITTREGKAEVIRYSDETKVTGAQTGVAGLASQTRTNVTVTFKGMGPAREATEIKVEKDKA